MDFKEPPRHWARWALCGCQWSHCFRYLQARLAPAQRKAFIFFVITGLIIAGGPKALWAAPSSSQDSQEQKKADDKQKLVPSQDKKSADNKRTDNKASGQDASDQDKKDISYGYNPPEVDKDGPNATWLLLKTLAILGVFIGGFYVLVRFLSKRGRSQVLGNNMVQVLANVPIANQRFLQIVDIAGGIYVLGVTEQSISLITRVQDPQLLQQIKVESSRIQQQQQNLHFSEWLQRALNGSQAPSSAQKSNLERSNLVSEFVTRHRQKMSELKKQAGGSQNEL